MKTIARHAMVRNKTVKFFPTKNLCLVVLLLALSTFGCAGPSTYRMYSGDDRPKTDIAIIKGSLYPFGPGYCDVNIADVNSQGLKLFPLGEVIRRASKDNKPSRSDLMNAMKLPQYEEVAMLPGFYTVEVFFGCSEFVYGTGSIRRANIGFNVEAGREYEIKGHWWKNPLQLFVVDRNSGEEVPAETVLAK